MMLLDRRSFACGSGALAVAGCATTLQRAAEGCTPLPRVHVEQSRVVRSVAGLRPYRASGFRVAREQFGDKALVHNYGHGGSGITFSWGTARLATNLGLPGHSGAGAGIGAGGTGAWGAGPRAANRGLPGHSGAVAVIGAGVIGLSTARLVQQAGFPVTIYTAALPPAQTSRIAGRAMLPSSPVGE